MLPFIVRRLVGLLVVLAVMATLLFALMKAAPGDPARMIAGQTADPRVLAEVRAEWHLDEPLLVQYAWWMGQLIQLDLPIHHRRQPLAVGDHHQHHLLLLLQFEQ